MQTLSEIVSSALEQVGEDAPSVKIASAADVPETPQPSFEIEEPATEKVATKAEILDDSAYALKLAQCLEVAGSIVRQKLAEEGPDVDTGNVVSVLESTDNTEVSLPPAPKGPVEQAVTTESATTAGPMPDSVEDHTGNPDWTNNKEAAYQAIQNKLEQAALLESIGETEKSAELLAEAEKLSVSNKWIADRLVSGAKKRGDTLTKLTPFAKTAGVDDPGDVKAQGRFGAALMGLTGAGMGASIGSSIASDIQKNPLVGAVLGAATLGGLGAIGGKSLGELGAKSYTKQMNDLGAAIARGGKTAEDLSVSNEIISNELPDNAGAIAMTTADARKKTQAEASEFLTQTAQKDPVVEASLANTEVAKVSSLLEAVQIRGLSW